MRKKTIIGLLAVMLMEMLSSALAMENGVYRDKAPGYGGDVIVTVVIRDGQIQSLTTENTGGEKSEYYLKAEEALSEAIVSANGLEGVDVVAGATGTSESILTAMRGILEQAAYTGAPLEGLNQMAEDAMDAVQEGVDNAANGVGNAVDNVTEGAEGVVNSVKEPTMTARPNPTV